MHQEALSSGPHRSRTFVGGEPVRQSSGTRRESATSARISGSITIVVAVGSQVMGIIWDYNDYNPRVISCYRYTYIL